ncbi:HAD-IB family phosphatase [Desulfobulbus alkaliphilus]|uniref:HAD-IB family phosphatase n=1 Tax=Desulfobulbus alkaliphilus TaxID=869814 RepID=UPI00196413F1|nr:HAD-IB family phosphatase [Desulfobulbus alkaliphilus]MBM9538757.1 HAD-IB family phosphatase [Desulfobulbus alkaliphilus]
MTDKVFISDFDGTMTGNEFYKLAASHLLPTNALDPWRAYLEGRVTHFAALQTIFAHISAPEHKILELLGAMDPDPDLAGSVERLRSAGWDVVVASAGCEWYIQRILAMAGTELTVHANPGEYMPGGPLRMQAPEDSPFYSLETGVDKAAVVRFHQQRATAVAFAGDGFTDLPAALLVRPALRFAHGDLAHALDRRDERYRPFAVWTDVVNTLLDPGEGP